MDKNSVFYSSEFEYSQDMQLTFDHYLDVIGERVPVSDGLRRELGSFQENDDFSDYVSAMHVLRDYETGTNTLCCLLVGFLLANRDHVRFD